MTWIFVALGGYFLNAVAGVLDKLLLAGRIGKPATYAFFVSLFSLFSFALAPFGLAFFGWAPFFMAVVSGMMFLYGLVALYVAVQKHEVSRVAPLVGMLAAFGVFVLRWPSLGSSLGSVHILAFALFFTGGFLLAFDLPLRKRESLPLREIAVAGVLTAFSIFLMKQSFAEMNFVSGLLWSRLGMFLGGVSLVLIPVFRADIFDGFHHHATEKQQKRSFGTAAIFLANKIGAGVATFLISYAIFLGSPAFVQALGGIQYAFLVLLAWPLAKRYPKIYAERLETNDWLQKLAGIALIGIGIWMAVTNGLALTV